MGVQKPTSCSWACWCYRYQQAVGLVKHMTYDIPHDVYAQGARKVSPGLVAVTNSARSRASSSRSLAQAALHGLCQPTCLGLAAQGRGCQDAMRPDTVHVYVLLRTHEHSNSLHCPRQTPTEPMPSVGTYLCHAEMHTT